MARSCEMCPPGSLSNAALYCEADACYLCAACDEEVHGANRLAGRHLRRRVSETNLLAVGSAPSLASAVSVASDLSIPSDHDMALPTLDDACVSLFSGGSDYDFADALALDTDALFQRAPSSCALSWEAVLGAALEPLSPDPAPPISFAPPVRRVKSEPVLARAAAICELPASPLSAATDSPRIPLRAPSTSPLPAPAPADDPLSADQRRQLRLKALARFRSKRASRSFAKKVRYECRKQLADSRPRVKGRFVKKTEMALYRKYGALYRNYMHELADAPPS